MRLAVKWMPGLSTSVAWDKMGFGAPTLGQNFGLEYRLSHYVALRADLEMRSGAGIGTGITIGTGAGTGTGTTTGTAAITSGHG